MTAGQQQVIAVKQADMQARQTIVIPRGQQFGFAQRGAQRVDETAGKPGEGFAGIGVGMLDDQGTERRSLEQGRNDRRDAVLRIDAAQFREQAQLLSGENEFAQREGLRQRMAMFAQELDVTTESFSFGVTGQLGYGRALAQFGREFGLEAGTAVAQQAV